MSEQWLTTREACAYLSVSRTTLGRMAKRLPIPRSKDKGVVRYRKSALDRAMGKREVAVRPADLNEKGGAA